MEIRTIGIDLGKTVFHFVGVNARGQVVVRKKGSRTQLLCFTEQSKRGQTESSFPEMIGKYELVRQETSVLNSGEHGLPAQR